MDPNINNQDSFDSSNIHLSIGLIFTHNFKRINNKNLITHETNKDFFLKKFN